MYPRATGQTSILRATSKTSSNRDAIFVGQDRDCDAPCRRTSTDTRRTYVPNSLEADVARMLAPEYRDASPTSSFTTNFSSTHSHTRAHHRRGSSSSTFSTGVYVDYGGELHDPDFCDFPIFGSPRSACSCGSCGSGSKGRDNKDRVDRRHTFSGRVRSPTSREGRRRALGELRWPSQCGEGDLTEPEEGRGDEEEPWCHHGIGHSRRDSISSYSSNSRPCSPPSSPTRASSARSSTPSLGVASYMYIPVREAASVRTAPSASDRNFSSTNKAMTSETFAVEDERRENPRHNSETRRLSLVRRRLMRTPPPSPTSSIFKHHDLPDGALSTQSSAGCHTRTCSGSLLQRVWSTVSNPPLPIGASFNAPAMPPSTDEKTEEVVTEYFVVPSDFTEPFEGAYPLADRESDEEIEGLRRRVRAMNLQVQTRLWRARREISTRFQKQVFTKMVVFHHNAH